MFQKIAFCTIEFSPLIVSYLSIFSMVTKFYQHVLAMAFAVREINENPKVLPNITLGFHIYDSYFDARATYKSTLSLLFKSHRLVLNYNCNTQKKLIATIGGLSSDTSSLMAEILGFHKIPQVRVMYWRGGIEANNTLIVSFCE